MTRRAWLLGLGDYFILHQPQTQEMKAERDSR